MNHVEESQSSSCVLIFHFSPGIWVRVHKEREEVAGRGVRHLVNYKNSFNKFTLGIFVFPNKSL